MSRPKIIVFATGERGPTSGGSGFKKLVEATRSGVLEAEIVGVVSPFEHGGVYTKAEELGIRFIHSPRPRTGADYLKAFESTRADFAALSGWTGHVEGLDPRVTFNIHPALDLKKFGGKGFHGHHVHEAVIEAYKRGEVTHSGVTMHFVTNQYDDPNAIFFQRKVEILEGDTPESLQKRVNSVEHTWQAIITNRVVHGKIAWDGRNPESIVGADIEI